MSSNYYPNCSWAVMVTDDSIVSLGLTAKFLIDNYTEYEGDKEEFEGSTVMEILENIATHNDNTTLEIDSGGRKLSVEIFVNSEMVSGSLDHDGLYFLISDTDLFIQRKSPFHDYLLAQNIKPEFHQWITYG